MPRATGFKVKKWNKVDNDCLRQLSILNWKKYILQIVSDFWIPKLDAQKLVFAPRTRCPGSSFWVTKKWLKTWKTRFFCFFHHRTFVFQRHSQKKQKMKITFMSILIPKCVFFKNKIKNILNPRVQFITKIRIFCKIKRSCNKKTLWKQFWKFIFCVCFGQKHTYNTTSIVC